MNRNLYLDGMMGLIVGDALGVPYEFSRREKLADEPATDMIGHGTYDLSAGTWSDDSSMALATLDSLRNGYDPEDIIINFSDWLNFAYYTPYGKVFDSGCTCSYAIGNYMRDGDIKNAAAAGKMTMEMAH